MLKRLNEIIEKLEELNKKQDEQAKITDRILNQKQTKGQA